MGILVIYESQHGRARRAANAIANAAATRGVATLVHTIDEIMPHHVAEADAVIAGCWTPGKIPFGDEPARRMAEWIDGLPPLDGKPVGVFCTYRFFPNTFADMATRTAETESELGRRFELKGAKIVATRSINSKSIDKDAAILFERVLEHMHGV